MNIKKNKVGLYSIIALISYFLLLKLYFLNINPLNLQSNIVAVNTHIFFNAKSFINVPQSFHDWNHPGTPLYYLTSLLFIFKTFDVGDIYSFLNIFHFFSFLILVFSIFYFANYFKNYLSFEYILIFLIIFSSFDTFLFSLEVVDYTNFKLSFSLLILIYFHKYLSNPNDKNLLKVIFVISLSNSFILSFLSLTIPIFLSIIYFQFKKRKFIQIIKNILFNIISLFILNFPILGRLPKIYYNVLFSREDTSFNLFETPLLLKRFIVYIYDNNILYLIPILTLLVLFFLSIKFIKKNNKNNLKNEVLFALCILILFFFIYTILASSNTKFGIGGHEVRGTALRNIFITCSFIFVFFLIKEFKYKKTLLFLSFILMLFSHYNYIVDRNNLKNISLVKEEILKYEINEKNLDKNNIIFFSDLTYGIEDFSIISIGNSVFGGELYNEEMIDEFPNLRFFRMNDILFKIRNEKIDENKHLLKIDKYLKEYLPNNIYLILTPRSHRVTSNWLGDSGRSKEIFYKHKFNEQAKLIVFNNSKLIGQDFNLLKNYIFKTTSLKYYENKDIEGDIWHFFY